MRTKKYKKTFQMIMCLIFTISTTSGSKSSELHSTVNILLLPSYSAVESLNNYGQTPRFVNKPDGKVPEIKTSAKTVAGAHSVFIDAVVIQEGGSKVIDKGICWSKEGI